jgi:hypothetical protein
MLKPVLFHPAFRRASILLILLSCNLPWAIAQPVPQISGPHIVCPGSAHFYSTPYVNGSTWTWSAGPGGTIVQDFGNFIQVLWNGLPNSTQTILVAETNGSGVTTTVSRPIFIQNNVLSCDDFVNVSLDQNGLAHITASMLLDGTYNTFDGYAVSITNQIGGVLGNPLTCANIGQALIGRVTDNCSGNSCWSNIRVEDKKAPQFDCPITAEEIPCDLHLDSIPHPPVYDNCDTNPLVSLSGITVDNSNICNGVSIMKWWVAMDDYGNESSCVQRLFIDPDQEVDFPEDTVWSCETYNRYPNVTDAKPLTDSLHTTGSGLPIGASGGYCKHNYIYHDDTLQVCGPTFKIIRTWTVVNWCTGQVITQDSDGDDSEQLIKIVDEVKPTITVPPVTVNANMPGPYATHCKSTGYLPAPTYSDNCSSVTIRIFTAVGEAVYVNGVDAKQGAYIPSPGLNIGTHIITYKATDDCGNVSELPVLLYVTDTQIPTVICDEYTDVNLDPTGYAEVFATTFDDGSLDNCCIDRYVVRKMSDPVSSFAPTVLFDCSEDTVLVVMRVYDCYNNHNECMVNVLVNDKIMPVCVPPPHKEISCLNMPGVIDSAWLNTLGQATTFDNCGSEITELPHQFDIDNCGEGQIIRRFRATDDSGNQSNVCQQIIDVTPVSDWVIHFPPDWYGSCNDAVNADSIIIRNFGCGDIFNLSIEDQYFAISNDSGCYKILRKFKLINWCNYNPTAPVLVIDHQPNGVEIDEMTHGHFSKIEYQQIIKVYDDTPPVLSYDLSPLFCIDETGCSQGDVFLPLDIDGECTNDFDIIYHLDLGNNGSYDYHGTGFFHGVLPIGKHRIVYLVEDGCNNDATFELLFEVKDCKKPTPVCEYGLIAEIMQTGSLTVCADIFDKGSYDNCPGPLTFTFSSDLRDSCRTFFCNQTYLELPVEIWVTDAAGNQAYCETFFFIQDNMFSCDSGIPIQGKIATEENKGVEAVKVQLNTNASSIGDTVTMSSGDYQFSSIETGNDYTVTPTKDDFPLNGVTTFDLVVISKHILGISLLDSPYKMIAADINRSNSITTFDLVELRKMVLLLHDDFPNNTSWRFVDKNYVFPNPQNPWSAPFPEVVSINNLDATVAKADFIAVKIGDVNGSAKTTAFSDGNADDRTGSRMTLQAQDVAFEQGELVTLVITSEDFIAVSGFQCLLEFDPSVLSLQNLANTRVTDADNFGLRLVEKGKITVSWHSPVAISLPDTEEVMVMQFEALKNSRLSDALYLNNRQMAAEAYTGELLETRTLGLQLQVPEHFANQLFQNVPNPFQESTTIRFSLAQPSRITLTVYDAYGKTLRQVTANFEAGNQEIILPSEGLPTDANLFYRLETSDWSDVKTMTKLR